MTERDIIVEGGWKPRRTGGRRVWEMVEERAESRREIQRGKLLLFVTAYHPAKETNPTTFLDFHLTFYKA